MKLAVGAILFLLHGPLIGGHDVRGPSVEEKHVKDRTHHVKERPRGNSDQRADHWNANDEGRYYNEPAVVEERDGPLRSSKHGEDEDKEGRKVDGRIFHSSHECYSEYHDSKYECSWLPWCQGCIDEALGIDNKDQRKSAVDACANDMSCGDTGWWHPFPKCKSGINALGDCTWLHGALKIPEVGYPVWLPAEEGSTYKKIDMPRKVMQGPVMEQVFYFDLNDQPKVSKDDIQFDGTHVTVPLFEEMLAGYSRSYNMYGESETGIVSLAFLPNEFSVITNKPYAGLVEKYHTLTYSGKWSEVRAEKIKKINADRGVTNEPWSEERRDAFLQLSTYLAMAWARRGIISAQVEAGVDKALLLMLRDYVKGIQDGEIPFETTVNSPGWQSHREKAIEAIALAKDPTFVSQHKKSEQHCKHFEQDMGLVWDKAGNTMSFPVGTPITTLGGEMQYTPNYYLGFYISLATVDYDPDTGILQIYFQAYGQSRQYTDPDIPIEDWPYESGIWVSSPGPEMQVSQQDGRTMDFMSFDPPSEHMFDDFMGIGFFDYKMDYRVFAHPKSVTCDSHIVDRINNEWAEVRLDDKSNPDSGFSALFNKIDSKMTLMRVAHAGVLCGDYYMRNDYGSDSFGYGINEQGVWMHLLLEVDAAHTEAIATANWWNHWECYYKGLDNKECEDGGSLSEH